MLPFAWVLVVVIVCAGSESLTQAQRAASSLDRPLEIEATVSGAEPLPNGLAFLTDELCRWQESYLAAVDRGDTEATLRALDMVGRWMSLRGYLQPAYPSDRSRQTSIFDEALAGDDRSMRADFDGGCASYRAERGELSAAAEPQ